MAPSQRHPAAAPAFLAADTPTDPPAESSPQLSAQSVAFLETQYARFIHDPNSVPPDWRKYFDELHADHDTLTPEVLQSSFRQESIGHRAGGIATAASSSSNETFLQEKLAQLTRNYRVCASCRLQNGLWKRMTFRPATCEGVVPEDVC